MSDDIPRDRWGRPRIVPPGGGDRVPYTRVTTMAGSIEDKEGLVKWKIRHVLNGMAMRPDLIGAVSAAADNDTLDAIGEMAADTSGSNDAARLGTRLHELCEAFDKTGEFEDEHRADVEAYAKATERLSMVSIETFGVIDEHRIAGSWDRVVRLPDGRTMIADIKTGDISRPLKIEMQLAMYSRATPYLCADDTRGESLADQGVDQDQGVVIHLRAGKASCDLYAVDLAKGWANTRLALQVRQTRRQVARMVALCLPFPTDAASDRITHELEACRSAEEMRRVYLARSGDGWSEEHTAYAILRKRFLLNEGKNA